MRKLFRSVRIGIAAFKHFTADEGWTLASHIALTALMALFPFLIVVTALAGSFFGSKALADEVARIMLDTWPHAVADPLAREIHDVLTSTRSDVLTVSGVLSVYFASSGIESLRIGLNRAYGVVEKRNWLLLRLESIAYVLVAAVALLAFAFLVVLGPLLYEGAVRHAPWLATHEWNITIARYGTAALTLVGSLVIAHKWLPAGRRRFRDIRPGIITTVVMWLAIGFALGRYLAEFSYTYVSYYAGLASPMIALVFLYWTASIFIFGGEVNAAAQGLRAGAKTGDQEPTSAKKAG